MKKSILSIILLLSTVLVFTACGNTVKNNATEAGKNTKDGRLKVYTSFYTMYDLTSKIGGDKINLTNLVPAGTEPHDWEPSSTDIVNLEQADMLIYNGVGMEHWVKDITASLQNKDLVLVEASNGIELLEGSHEHHENGKQEEEHDEEEHDAKGDFDPHVWLNIRNAKKEMENIKAALVTADPDNAEYYEENYKNYAAKFDELDVTFKESLSKLENKDIVVAHQAFAYLCEEYGLNQVAVEGLSPDSEPDAKKMSEIITFARENNITTIFFEELVNPKVAETIASEIGAETEVLNPLEGLTKEQINSGEDYLSVMESNLKALIKALDK